MTVLHIAALPFPSPQGTQAAVHQMLRALSEGGGDHELLTYGYGANPDDAALPYRLRRLDDFPKVRSLRSGPSIGKVALDLRLASELRRLRKRDIFEGFVAHHIEAAIAASLAGCRPLVYFAHTSLAEELPLYFPASARSPFRRSGAWLEENLCRNAEAVVAISPRLASDLSTRTGVDVCYVPTPWPLPDPTGDEERVQARTTRGIDPADHVLLYVGNLDAYQGWERLLETAAALKHKLARMRLLVGTASRPEPLLHAAKQAGLAASLHVEPLLGSESQRRALHACASVALIPRRAPGGLPIKLLDALARGVPVITSELASAGLALNGAAELPPDNAEAWSSAALELLRHPSHRSSLAAAARTYIARKHSDPAFIETLESLIRNRRPSGPRNAFPQKRPD